MDPPAYALPAILDPLLDYLAEKLPPPVYSILMTVAAHSLALLGALYNLTRLLFSSSPAQWNAQTLIPPLIALLTAYLALLSVYRTTSWMFRTGLFFAKWGSILAALVGGAGYFYGAPNANAQGGGGGLARTLTGWALDALNGAGQNAGGRPREHAPRPRAWESWDAHREWQYEEERYHEGEGGAGDTTEAVREVIGQVLGFAGGIVRQAGWWDVIKDAVEGAGGGEDGVDEDEGASGRRRQPARKAKTKAKSKKNAKAGGTRT